MLSKEPEAEVSDTTMLLPAPKPGHKRETFEDKMEVIETYCKQFACAKKLSLMETLLGNKCIEHAQIKPQKFINGLL